MARQARDVSCRVGLNAAEVGSWSWLSENRQAPDLIENWWNTFKAFVLGTVDVDLQPVSWDQKYERWNDAVEAQEWGGDHGLGRGYPVKHRYPCCDDKQSGRERRTAEGGDGAVGGNGCSESIQSDGKFIEDWLGAYAQLAQRHPVH